MTKKHTVGLVLVGVAAATLLFAATTTWFQNRGGMGEFRIGLLGWEQCVHEMCTELSLDAFKKDHGAFVHALRATFALGLLSVAMLVGLGVLVFIRHRRVHGLGKIALLTLIVTIMSALVVVAYKPALANAGLGVLLFMLGGMTGVIGAQRLSAPGMYEDELLDPSISGR